MLRMRFLLAVCLGLTIACVANAAVMPGAQAQGTHFVYLIRHGIYERDSTRDDIAGNGLNALGHEQAILAGRRLYNLPVKINSLVSSDYLRAVETADEIGKILGLMPTRDSLIHECTPRGDRPRTTMSQANDDLTLCESNLQSAYARYFRPTPEADTRDVLVSHGNAIRWLVCRALGMDTKQWGHFDIANGSLTVIAVRADGSVRLAEFSDTGHLPVPKQTWTGKGAGWSAPPAK